MEGDGSFIAALTEAIEQRHQYMEHTVLPKLKDRFRVFHASLQSLIAVMVRKGLIQEDPYKTEQKISGLDMPEDTEFPDGERTVVVGIRLSNLDNVLEYTDNYVSFSVASLHFAELKKLAELVRYIAWDDLKPNSPRPTTRVVSELMSKLRMGADSFASGIFSSALKQLADGCQSILADLKTVRAFQRERYKLDLRTMVMPNVPQPETLKPGDAESLGKVRPVFAASGMPGPFIPELVGEVLAEDHGPDSEKFRSATLARLRTQPATKKKKTAPPVSLSQLLIDAIRAIAAASRALDESLERLRENAAILQTRKQSFGARFREWLDRLFKRSPESHVYELEFMDEGTGTRHRESVDLDSFLEKLHKKSQTYGGILSRSGSLWSKIEHAGEDQLYKFVNKELGDLHLIHRRALAFDSFFKSQSTSDEKRKLRGIKIEITTMRNAIAKASQLKHEYVSRKEEEDQLKKLGISSQ